MKISAEILCDSIGPNGKRITTFLLLYPRFIHSEHLRHRTQSFSVASSRAIPAEKLMKQVKEDPAMPIMWPKQHKGMQGTEVFEPIKTASQENMSIEHNEAEWLQARDSAVHVAERLSDAGVSKQLTNRLIEPWVTTRCVCTATEWDGFFKLRHPHYVGPAYEGVTEESIVWGTDIDLNFPAEYNIQQLAICMKKAMDESTPQKLEAGQWHLPFVTETDDEVIYKMSYDAGGMNERPDGLLEEDVIAVKLSAARCAYTSYDHNNAGDVEKELKLADRLIADKHWSPFEHQAMATDFSKFGSMTGLHRDLWKSLPDGLEYRYDNKTGASLHSRNFSGGWVQARATLDS